MKGTEKQIEWATKIKNDFIEEIEKRLNDAKERVERRSMPIEWFETGVVVKNSLLKTINKWDAAEIIDNRNSFPNFNYFHINNYKKVKSCEKAKQKMKHMFAA